MLQNFFFSSQWWFSLWHFTLSNCLIKFKKKTSEKLLNIIYYTHNLQNRWLFFLYNKISREENCITSLNNPLKYPTSLIFCAIWIDIAEVISFLFLNGQYVVTFSVLSSILRQCQLILNKMFSVKSRVIDTLSSFANT